MKEKLRENKIELENLSIASIHEGYSKNKFTCEQLITQTFARIAKLDPVIKAFITVTKDEALNKAKIVDKKIKSGKKLKFLEGIPYSAKDVFCTKGVQSTGSSGILEGFIPPYSATVIEKIEAEGAILIGKTNCDPFGFGSSTENSYYQVTTNPWNTAYVPGGSSGGSAAAVISGMGVFSLGEDTGGSIRQPSCFCSTVGIKVTYGLVSRYGVMAYGSSLDTIGVFTRDCNDLALLLKIMAGKDDKDSTTSGREIPDYERSLERKQKSLTIGLPREYFTKNVDTEVIEAVKEAVHRFKEMGYGVKEISLPYTDYAIAAYYLSGISEVSANLARYDGMRFGYSDRSRDNFESIYLNSRGKRFSDEVKRRVMIGTYALSSGYYEAYYNKAQQVRTLIKNDLEEKFKEVDFIIAPVSPVLPFKIGENTKDPLKMWLVDAFTVTINPAGIPSLAIPCGFSESGLPIGMQLIGPMFSEELLINIAHQYQKITDWHKRRPSILSKNYE